MKKVMGRPRRVLWLMNAPDYALRPLLRVSEALIHRDV